MSRQSNHRRGPGPAAPSSPAKSNTIQDPLVASYFGILYPPSGTHLALGLPDFGQVIVGFQQFLKDAKTVATAVKYEVLSCTWKVHYSVIGSYRSAGPASLPTLNAVLMQCERVFGELKISIAKASEAQGRTPAHLSLLYQTYIYLGDLARYKVQHLDDPKQPGAFKHAKQHYLDAAILRPDVGNAHNQLAVVAAYGRDHLECFYRSVLSLVVRKPFSAEAVKKNLRTIIEATRAESSLALSLEQRFVWQFCYAFGALYSSTTLEERQLQAVMAEWAALTHEDPLAMESLGILPCRVLTICVFVVESAQLPACRAQAIYTLVGILITLFDGLSACLEKSDGVNALCLLSESHAGVNLGLLWICQNLTTVLAASPLCRDSLRRLSKALVALGPHVPLGPPDAPMDLRTLPEATMACATSFPSWSQLPEALTSAGGCEDTLYFSEEQQAVLRFRITWHLVEALRDRDVFDSIPPDTRTIQEAVAHLAEPDPQQGDEDDDDDIVLSSAFHAQGTSPLCAGGPSVDKLTPVDSAAASESMLSTFALAWGGGGLSAD